LEKHLASSNFRRKRKLEEKVEHVTITNKLLIPFQLLSILLVQYIIDNATIIQVTTYMIYALSLPWNVGHRPLHSIQLCPVLPPPHLLPAVLETFMSPDHLPYPCSLVFPRLCDLVVYTVCLFCNAVVISSQHVSPSQLIFLFVWSN